MSEKKNPLIKFENIGKRFGRIEALKDISFSVFPGEIVGLVGDNGAGKTTVVKILAGIYKPDKGKIYIGEEEANITSPEEARRAGIDFVHQDIGLAEDLEIRRNIFLGDEIVAKRVGPIEFLDLDKMSKGTKTVYHIIGITSDIDPKTEVSELSGGQRQGIKIGRAVYYKARLIVLDEPVRALSVRERGKIKNLIVDLNKKEGISFIYITHNIREVYDVAHKFVLLDRGIKIGEIKKEETSVSRLEESIIKGELVSP